jgi:high frequency lysogenization protein
VTLDSIENQTLALAGVFQACWQVRELAWEGKFDEARLGTSLGSIFKIDSSDVADVYGGIPHLHKGLWVLREQLGGEATAQDMEIGRYVAALLQLESRLYKRDDLLQEIHQSVVRASPALEQYPLDHPNIAAKLADIYSRTVSTIPPRVMVNGNPIHLNDNDTASRIRSLLLAGIRSAVLFRQCGGSRLWLLFRRGKYVRAAERFLGQMPH